jgi:protocatechuate 3,4-dioxygenase, alpha subunit
VSVPATTWQTVGPFFSIGLSHLYRDNLAAPSVTGERIEVTGIVLDGDSKPIPDAILEIWQANSHGKYAHPDDLQDKPLEKDFAGYGRVPTDEDGRFRFTTIKPGRVPGPEGPNGAATLQAPHLVISLLMRGLLRRLVTRMYFPGEPGNSEDYVLNLVDPARRHTLIAKPVGNRAGALEWNLWSQGAEETVFFDC